MYRRAVVRDYLSFTHLILTTALIQGHIPFQNISRSERTGHETAFLPLGWTCNGLCNNRHRWSCGQTTQDISYAHSWSLFRTFPSTATKTCFHSLLIATITSSVSDHLVSISQNNWPLSAPNFPVQTLTFAP